MPSYSRKVSIPGKSSDELYQAISKDIDRFMSKTPIGKYEIDRLPDTKQVIVKSSMFNATLTCTDASMSLDAKLSLLAAPFKSKLDDGITHWLKKTFNLETV